jgi:hypothetical protein
MTTLEKHRQNWQGKSDEWLFDRLDRELNQKVETIHGLLDENEVMQSKIIMLEARLETAEKLLEKSKHVFAENASYQMAHEIKQFQIGLTNKTE